MTRYVQKLICIVMSVVMLLGVTPVAATAQEREVTLLYDKAAADASLLCPSEEEIAAYPNGALLFPLTSADLEMKEYYAVDVYRQGGIEGEASVTVSAIDLSAHYGRDYALFTSLAESSEVDGEALPLMEMGNTAVNAQLVRSESLEIGNDEERNVDYQTIGELIDSMAMTIPTSAKLTLHFADGEATKRFYIETYQKDEVTDDVQFSLTLSAASGAVLAANQTATFNIKERREKPETYIAIKGATVDPESHVAKVTVTRTGNTGTTVNYRLVTQSGTAVVGEAYEATQRSLTFLSGMNVQTVEIPLLSPENGTSFDVMLEEVRGATVVSNRAAVDFADGGDIMLTATGLGDRGEIVVDLHQDMKEDIHTERGSFKHKWTYSNTAEGLHLNYDNKANSRVNAIGAVSKDKYDFIGVDKIRFTMNIDAGSVAGDRTVVYASNDRYWNENTGDFDNLFKVDDRKEGKEFGMSAIANDYVTETGDIVLADQRYLRLAVVRDSGLVNDCGAYFYNDEDYHLSFLLTKYTVKIDSPEEMDYLVDGRVDSIVPVHGVEVTDPAAKAGNDASSKSVGMYRDETTNITWDGANLKGARFVGVQFINNSDTSKVSGVYKMSSTALTLTANVLRTYADYIDGTTVRIRPVFELRESDVSVQAYTSEGDDTAFALNGEYSGVLTKNGVAVGSASWQMPTDGVYHIGDSVRFTASVETAFEDLYEFKCFEVRQSDTQLGLSSATVSQIYADEVDVDITANYVSVKPLFGSKNGDTVLVVTNAECGDFTGKTDSSVTGTFTVYDEFSSAKVGDVVTMNAVPNSGYRARWEYTDVVTGTRKTYFGGDFYYVMQSVLDDTGNYVTLTFEKTASLELVDVYVGGKLFIQDGTILHPPKMNDESFSVVNGGSIFLGGLAGVSAEDGSFTLSEVITDPDGSERYEPALMTVGADEMYRARIVHDNRYYLVDVDMSQYITQEIKDTDSVCVELKMEYITFGPRPVSVSAHTLGGTTYQDSIMLTGGENTRIELVFTDGGYDQVDINMVRWTLEDSDGAVQYTYDDEITDGEIETMSLWTPALGELARPGQKIYVELMNKYFDDDAEALYVSYGRFHTGYVLTAAAVGTEVSYVPDIGVDLHTTAVTPLPAFGTWNPTFSFKGFTPVFNVEDGELLDGTPTKTITIGVSFGKMKNFLAQDPEWGSVGWKDKARLMTDTLDNYNEAIRGNIDGSGKKFAGPSQTHTALGLAKVAPSFSVTVCVQLNYMLDDEGAMRVISSYIILGAQGGIHFSMPFVVWGMPCFGMIDDTLSGSVFVGCSSAKLDENGNSVPLYLYELDDPNNLMFDGLFGFSNVFKIGVGVGFDGLVSASGGVGLTINFDFSHFEKGKGVFTMDGFITAELLFLKHTWSHDLFKAVMFDNTSLADEEQAVRKAREMVVSEYEKDLLATPLSELSMGARTSAVRTSSVAQEGGVLLSGLKSTASSSMVQLDDGTYFVVGAPDDITRVIDNNRYKLRYGIYDPDTDAMLTEGAVMDALIADAAQEDVLQEAAETLDYDPHVYDAGENLLIVWNKANVEFDDETGAAQMLKSMEIAGVFYSKSTGEFFNYFITDSADNVANFKPQAVYDEATDSVQVFWQQMDASEMSEASTIKEIEQMPTTLMTASVYTADGTIGSVQPVSQNRKFLKHFDVMNYDGKTYLLYAAGDVTGLNNENNQSILYLNVYTHNAQTQETALEMHTQLLSDEYYAASVKLAEVTTDVETTQVSNLLAFYKCNDRYAYTNLTEALALVSYQTADGQTAFASSAMRPVYLTSEGEEFINDDVQVAANDSGWIYQLWTQTGADEQQIYGRRFYYTDMQTVTEKPFVDATTGDIAEVDGVPQMVPLDEAVTLVHGEWGPAVPMTDNTDYPYKKGVTPLVNDDGTIAMLYNQYQNDLDLSAALTPMTREELLAFEGVVSIPSEDTAEIVENQLVLRTYTPKVDMTFVMDGAIVLSDDFVKHGEAVSVSVSVKNNGMLVGRGTQVTLYENGTPVETKTFDVWNSSEGVPVSFDYSLPTELTAQDVVLSVGVTDPRQDGEVLCEKQLAYHSNVEIAEMKLLPLEYIDGADDTVTYQVTARLVNNGNDVSDPTAVHFVKVDEQRLAICARTGETDGVYTPYGGAQVPSLAVREEAIVTFISDEIPASAYNVADTATFVGMTARDDADIEHGKYGAEYYIGITKRPERPVLSNLSLGLSEDVLDVGEQALLVLTAKKDALYHDAVTYMSSDASVAFVNDLGVVVGLRPGTAEITAMSESGVSATVTVTVAQPTIAQAVRAYYYVNGRQTLTAGQHRAFDINADGEVKIADALQLYYYVNGKVSQL